MKSGIFVDYRIVASILTGINMLGQEKIDNAICFILGCSYGHYQKMNKQFNQEEREYIRRGIAKELWENNPVLQKIMQKRDIRASLDLQSAVVLTEILLDKLDRNFISITRSQKINIDAIKTMKAVQVYQLEKSATPESIELEIKEKVVA